MGQDVFTTSRQVTPGINSNSLQIYIRKEREKRDVNKGMDGGEGGREGLEGMTNILRVISHFQ